MPRDILAEVVVDIADRRVDKIFQYLIPKEIEPQVKEGSRVEVPFGERRFVEGFVVRLNGENKIPCDSAHPKNIKFKKIKRVIDKEPPVTPDLLELARWMADYYMCPLVTCLQCFLPQGVKRNKAGAKLITGWRLSSGFVGVSPASHGKLTAKQQKALDVLKNGCPVPVQELCTQAGITVNVIKGLAGKGMIEKVMIPLAREPWDEKIKVEKEDEPQLTKEQENVLEKITKALGRGRQQTFLLHGVTGSGKTEVYLKSIAEALSRGRQAIMLVPEISLTPQMVDIFRQRFGSDVAIMHSRLAEGERFDQWHKIRNGIVRVVVGARSAVFAPLPNLGIIVVDEEHESSYKQDENPRYHARDIAIKRAELGGAVAVLGSATPSLESFYRTYRKKYTLLQMPQRIEGRPLPPVSVVDMRTELQEGNRSIFSRSLAEKIKERLDRSEQTLLFLNRRGYATFVVCRECGLAMKCPRCAISLTYHAANNSLYCHHCRFMRKVPSVCPRCGSRHIRYFGTGTQKVEEFLGREFPTARVLRMDVDSTRRKGAHTRILEAFKKGEADILVGTQMIAKGLDIPGVTLVGVITADTSLNMPDFRAAERTFQLLTQVAGRAGRGEAGGEVIIQTYMPDHYSVQTAQNHDYHSFFRLEMAQRRAFGYPPLTHVARIIISGSDENMVRDTATALTGAAAMAEVQLLGPAPAPIARIKEKHRWNIIVLAGDPVTLRNEIKGRLSLLSGREKVKVSIDIDAQSML